MGQDRKGKTLTFGFATMSLGGFNGTVSGAKCSTATQLVAAWWMEQLKKRRRYDLSPEDWGRIGEQAERIMRTRGQGSRATSKYWKTLRSLELQDNHLDEIAREG